MLRVAVDFGTSSTCSAAVVDGRAPQVVVVDGGPLLPSAVYVTADRTMFVGHEADRHAALDPARYEPHPKRRIDEAELLLGDTVLPVVDVVRAVLRRALQEARHLAGGAPVDHLVLTHPADWGPARTQRLRGCAHGLATDITLVPEPVAAAVFHASGHAVPDGGCLAVLDLGGGTVDASVVRRIGPRFSVLSTRGDPNFGGADIDQALLEHVGANVAVSDSDAWRRLVDGRELVDRRRQRVLRQDIRGAKETLSRHTYTDVPMPAPFPDAHLTRDDLERLINEPIRRTITLLARTIADARLRPEQLVAVFLVGGSSRIPLVSRVLHERLGVVPVTLDQPETVVARGALLAAVAAVAAVADPSRQPLRPPPRTSPGVPRSPGPGSASRLPIPAPGPPAAPAPRATNRPAYPPGQPAPVPPRPAKPARRFTAPRTRRWLIAAAILAALLAVAAVIVVVTSLSGPDHHYRFTVPDGWQRVSESSSTGDTGRKTVVMLSPTDRPAWPDQIRLDEFELAYDAGADHQRAVAEVRAKYDDQRARQRPPSFANFDASASFAGRDVLYYSEAVGASTVDWYVMFGGHYQVSVGCHYDEGGTERVRAACEQVVRTLIVDG